ncbi:hypothetical protein SHINM1_018160 [Fluviibacter phosphoraccumulans]|nr:hypothetical protein SHINM1_018160 [Fluviibacter phosphoraccumulans]
MSLSPLLLSETLDKVSGTNEFQSPKPATRSMPDWMSDAIFRN